MYAQAIFCFWAEAYNDEIPQVLQGFEATRSEITAANRLIESQISERTQLLMLAFPFSQEIVGQLDLNHFLRLVAEKAMALLGAHSSALCLFEIEGELSLPRSQRTSSIRHSSAG